MSNVFRELLIRECGNDDFARTFSSEWSALNAQGGTLYASPLHTKDAPQDKQDQEVPVLSGTSG